MDEQKNNTRILFTAKADSALDDIIKNFGLEETEEEFANKNKVAKLSNIVVIDHLAKDFARKTISEKDLIDSLKKDLEVSQQTAEQISKEVLTKIIPFLVETNEKDLGDPAFVEDVYKKISGSPVTKTQDGIMAAPKKQEKIKKIIPLVETTKIAPQIKQRRGSDGYREPIE